MTVGSGGTWLATASRCADSPGDTRLGLASALPVEDRGRGRLAFVELPIEVSATSGRLWHEPFEGVVARLRRAGVPGPVIDRAQRGLIDLAVRFQTRAWPFDGWLDGQAERLARRLAA
jgi:hypothetical protein